MNNYNENLQQTVVDTLSALSSDQAKLDSEKKAAEYTLYYAQGAEIKARDKLDDTNDDIKTWQPINDQSLIGSNQVFNLLTSATDANADVKTSITNTATAAANVQIASNAISDLASDIGAALNIATATLYQTDVYSKIKDANNFINEVANESKNISQNSMNASGYTSEITIAEVLAQTETVKAKIDNMYKSTQAELDKFSKLALKENGAIGQASIAEHQAEGGLLDARKEVEAIKTAYINTNEQLNLGLDIKVMSGFKISVTFAALPNPFPTFNVYPKTDQKIPPAAKNYYLILVPAQNQTTFTMNQAEQYFQQQPKGNFNPFLSIKPENTSVIICKPETSEPKAPVSSESSLCVDVFGNAIQQGSNYVAYIYIELSQQYKQIISNFSDLLSAPSQDFTLATKLPLAGNLLKPTYSTESDHEGPLWLSATFNAASAKAAADKPSVTAAIVAAADKAVAASKAAAKEAHEAYKAAVKEHEADPNDPNKAAAVEDANVFLEAANDAVRIDEETALEIHEPSLAAQAAASAVKDFQLEFQCILIEKTLDPKREYLLSDEGIENKKQNIPPIYFNVAIAQQVSPANYITATSIKDKAGQYEIKFTSAATDNFGNLIKPNVEYLPYILTVVGGGKVDQREFTQVLASSIESHIICKKEKIAN